jgi:hypothetical protein
MTGIMAMAAAQPALAGEDGHHMGGMSGHMQGDHHKEAMKEHSHKQGDMSSMKGMFLKKKEIDGYTVSFHVMKVKEGMQHGGTHNFMVKVEKDGKALTDLVANSKVTHPNGKSESKMLMKMGDWYMAGYDLDHDGQHQLMVLFKTSDGTKHFGGVYYPKDNR